MNKVKTLALGAAILMSANVEAISTCVRCPLAASLNTTLTCRKWDCYAMSGDWGGLTASGNAKALLRVDNGSPIETSVPLGSVMCHYDTTPGDVQFAVMNPLLTGKCTFPHTDPSCLQNEFSCS